MSAFETTRPAPFGATSPPTVPSQLVSNVLASVKNWNDARVTRKALVEPVGPRT